MDAGDVTRRSVRMADGRVLDAWIADGDGVPFVFHFGTPSSGLPFDAHLAAAHERDLRWISWSRPGYGSSTRHEGRSVADVVSDTHAVLDAVGADRAFVAGWSGGGPHALACAALMPERVIGASTIASVAPHEAAGLDWLADMGAENVEEFGAALGGPARLAEWMEVNWRAYRDVSAEQVDATFGDLVDDVDRGALTGDFAEFVAANMGEGVGHSYAGWLDDDLAFTRPWGFGLESFAVPVHIWQGAHDRMVPFAHGQWLGANCAGACAHLLPEHGHLSLVVDSFGAILDEMMGRS